MWHASLNATMTHLRTECLLKTPGSRRAQSVRVFESRPSLASRVRGVRQWDDIAAIIGGGSRAGRETVARPPPVLHTRHHRRRHHRRPNDPSGDVHSHVATTCSGHLRGRLKPSRCGRAPAQDARTRRISVKRHGTKTWSLEESPTTSGASSNSDQPRLPTRGYATGQLATVVARCFNRKRTDLPQAMGH